MSFVIFFYSKSPFWIICNFVFQRFQVPTCKRRNDKTVFQSKIDNIKFIHVLSLFSENAGITPAWLTLCSWSHHKYNFLFLCSLLCILVHFHNTNLKRMNASSCYPFITTMFLSSGFYRPQSIFDNSRIASEIVISPRSTLRETLKSLLIDSVKSCSFSGNFRIYFWKSLIKKFRYS